MPMGYGLSVFLVPCEALALAFGRNDEALRDEALAALEADLADYDRQMDAPSPDNDVDLSHAAALREIFAGSFTEDVPGARYGWAFEALCRFLGESLENSGFIPCNSAWYNDLDEVLAEHQVPLEFSDLIDRSPIPFPEPDDWPCIGHWGDAHLAAADPLATALGAIDDPEIRTALETALGWLRAARGRPGSLIVGFHG
ncbi:DUF7691 family protein [Paludisphaera mucosa]|uniref:DUF7691 domain-containing protein n=1 Tax=Paludisphaera mucosa TaxID=3030827 RepID=A0ABT6FKK9_9BACT|nr:hypothetical protein [Paludisphaera mucosa]MDG3008051.1 hypothetical protein [Paludisphaera mucosa]